MRKNKTINTLKALGVDVELIPENILKHAYEIVTEVGLGQTLEIGFILNEDLELIKKISEYLPALKIVTSKKELFDLRLENGDKHVGFTHINSYYEDNIFYVLYAIPAQKAFEQKENFKKEIVTNDLAKLKHTYTDIGIDFVVRENGDYQYLFIGKPEHASDIRWMDDNFETTELDTLLIRNKYFEFEKEKLVSW